jgi:hypothetical protein
MKMRTRLALAALLAVIALPPRAMAQACAVEFEITITQGVGPMTPGTRMTGAADFTLQNRAMPAEAGNTVHLAQGEMRLGPSITGQIWALVTTSNGAVADLIGLYARDVQGMSFAGLTYAGPMMITLYGPPGTRPTDAPPLAQRDWDAMTTPRRFALHSQGYDRLAGDVTALRITCD